MQRWLPLKISSIESLFLFLKASILNTENFYVQIHDEVIYARQTAYYWRVPIAKIAQL